METNIVFFENEAEIKKYYRTRKLEYVDDAIERANEEKWFYDRFGELKDAKVGYFIPKADARWSDLAMCVIWKGVTLKTLNPNRWEENKTLVLRLAEPLDKKGMLFYASDDGQSPNRIGTPTEKKLDAWLEWLLKMRKADIEKRDRMIAEMLATIEHVCSVFPEARNVKWENGYWTFTVKRNGLKYCTEINRNGDIYTSLGIDELAAYPLTTTEIAARMMQNGLEGAGTGSDRNEAYKVIAGKREELIRQFIGQEVNM